MSHREKYSRAKEQHRRIECHFSHLHKDLSVPSLLSISEQQHQGETVTIRKVHNGTETQRTFPRVSRTVTGALSVVTYPHTGRSPEDKFLVPTPEQKLWSKNKTLSRDHFNQLSVDALTHLQQKRALFEQNLWAGWGKYRKHVRVISSEAVAAAFADNLFRVPTFEESIELGHNDPDILILHAPDFEPDSEIHGTRKPADGNAAVAIALDFNSSTVVIAGTHYLGEIKKSIFTMFNGTLPQEDIPVFPMHCSAVVNQKGEVIVFFGLSGTGKTTLSSSPGFELIGDDEHGWSTEGVFNIEGGFYPKVIGITKDSEPEIFAAVQEGTAILENVPLRPDGTPNFKDDYITENTRAACSLQTPDWQGDGEQPTRIFFLAADASGVLPPISILTPEQIPQMFLAGYTSKVAGTEKGVTQPKPEFSACFASPFLPLHPTEYVQLLHEYIQQRHEQGTDVKVFMINTGWTGEAYENGHFDPSKRMRLSLTRQLVSLAAQGYFDDSPTQPSVFGLQIPVGTEFDANLQPENSWNDLDAFQRNAKSLGTSFQKKIEELS